MNQTEQIAYNTAVQVVAWVLTVGTWLFTIGLLLVDIAVLVTHFHWVPCLFAFTGAWLFILGNIVGRSHGIMASKEVMSKFAERQLTEVDTWSRLGCVLANMDEGYAISKESFGDDKTRFWLMHSSDDGETWHKVDYFGGDADVIDFEMYRKERARLESHLMFDPDHNDHEGA